MPLLNIIGLTSLNTTFHFGFVFLSEEKEEDYTWALGCVREIYSGFTKVRPGDVGLEGPGVVVVDRDLALITALRKVYYSFSS